MSGFLYFLPELDRPATLDDVAAAGLAHAFEKHADVQSAPLVGRSPSGGLGMLVFSQERLGNAPPGYRPEAQTWRKVPGSTAHVGFYREFRPGPASLVRSAAMAGSPVKLGDGAEWIAPRLKAFAGDNGFEPLFPLVADLDDDGNWISGGASPLAQRLAALFDGLYEHMSGEGVSTGQALDWAAELLGVNYAISRVEAAMLGLLETSSSLHRILSIATDWDNVMAWAQKKIAESAPLGAAG